MFGLRVSWYRLLCVNFFGMMMYSFEESFRYWGLMGVWCGGRSSGEGRCVGGVGGWAWRGYGGEVWIGREDGDGRQNRHRRLILYTRGL